MKTRLILLTAFGLGVMCGRVFACDSFQDCAQKVDRDCVVNCLDTYTKMANAYAIEDLAKAVRELK